MAAAGVPVSIISKILNHAEGGVTQIYDRFSYAKEKAQASASEPRAAISEPNSLKHGPWAADHETGP